MAMFPFSCYGKCQEDLFNENVVTAEMVHAGGVDITVALLFKNPFDT